MQLNMTLEHHVNVTFFFGRKFATLASFKSSVGVVLEEVKCTIHVPTNTVT